MFVKFSEFLSYAELGNVPYSDEVLIKPACDIINTRRAS